MVESRRAVEVRLQPPGPVLGAVKLVVVIVSAQFDLKTVCTVDC